MSAVLSLSPPGHIAKPAQPSGVPVDFGQGFGQPVGTPDSEPEARMPTLTIEYTTTAERLGREPVIGDFAQLPDTPGLRTAVGGRPQHWEWLGGRDHQARGESPVEAHGSAVGRPAGGAVGRVGGVGRLARLAAILGRRLNPCQNPQGHPALPTVRAGVH
jgi:hypothetical protein